MIKLEGVTLETAKVTLGEIPETLKHLSCTYSTKLIDLVNNNADTKKKVELAHSYLILAGEVFAQQITKVGRFTPVVDFSLLKDIPVFGDNSPGVNVCTHCKGAGGLYKFKQAPREVTCPNCSYQKFEYPDPEDPKVSLNIVISGKKVFVDGGESPRFKELIGKRVENCNSCNGTGRFITTSPEKDLVINVQCKTCKGLKYHPDNEKTQVIVKCRTCNGTRKAWIMMISGEVEGRTVCPVCDGFGFVKPAPGPDNPVLPQDFKI